MIEAINRRLAAPGAFKAKAAGLDAWIGPGLVAALGLLAAGLLAPAIAAQKWVILADRISLFDAILRLMRGPEWFLGVIVLLFSVLLPIAKIFYLLKLVYRGHADGARLRRAVGFIDMLGKWSMLDVFVVALAIVMFKAGTGADAHVLPGIYLFLGSVVLTAALSGRIKKRMGAAL